MAKNAHLTYDERLAIQSSLADRLPFKTIRSDILRLAGLIDRVVEEYKLFRTNDQMLEKIINFEVRRARRKDAGRYTMGDI